MIKKIGKKKVMGFYKVLEQFLKIFIFFTLSLFYLISAFIPFNSWLFSNLKKEKYFLFFLFGFIFFAEFPGFCQIPSLTGTSPLAAPPSESRRTQMSAITQRAMAEAMSKILSNPNGAEKAVPLAESTGSKSSSSPLPQAQPTGSSIGSGTQGPVYDSSIDNHLKVPNKPTGIFGRHIKEAEKLLRGYGAKPYSYVFGKCSRMTLSAYIITLMFDRQRKLGDIIIEPRAPLTRIESKARAFFLQLFLKEAKSEKLAITSTQKMLKLTYAGNVSSQKE